MDKKQKSTRVLPPDVADAVAAPERLAVLHGLEMLDTRGDADFDRISGLAAAIMAAPVALITLIDTERQWFKSRRGIEETETPTDISFCAHAIAAGDDPMVVTDANGVIQDINPAFTAVTGYGAEDVIGRTMAVLSSGRHDKDFYRAMWARLRETGRWSGDIHNRRKSGEEYVERLSINTSYNQDGSVNCRIGLFSDVTEKRRREASIWHQAHYDHLTQLPNRQMFQENLRRSIEHSRQGGLPFALAFLDLDLFKEVNDTLGHDAGDQLPRLVARRLGECVRSSDMVARLGGDEFTLIVRDIRNPDDVLPLCGKVLESLAQPYALGDSVARISASMGVAFYPRDGDSASELLRAADLAMYAAKEHGRNQCLVYEAGMRGPAHVRAEPQSG